MRATRDHREPAAYESVDSLAEPLLTAVEAAELLHIPRSTLYELVRSGGLPFVRIGRRGLRFTRTDLARWVEENTFAA